MTLKVVHFLELSWKRNLLARNMQARVLLVDEGRESGQDEGGGSE